MYEALPWIIGSAAAVNSLFRKNDTAFGYFINAFLVSTFLYFCYASLIQRVVVSDFLSILPFHLALLMFLCLAYSIKSGVKYETFDEVVESRHLWGLWQSYQ